jgi:hypothetical protein
MKLRRTALTPHQMVKAIYGKVRNSEEISRRTGIKSKLIRGMRDDPKYGIRKQEFEQLLLQLYRELFPEPLWSPHIESIDWQLQSAFYDAIRTTNGKRRGDNEQLIEVLAYWPLLRYDIPQYADPAGLAYERVRFPLIAAWARVPLPGGPSHPAELLKLALDSIDPCWAALGREQNDGLRARVRKAQLSATQRLAYQEGQHRPLTSIMSQGELIDQTEVFLRYIESWPLHHIQRANWAKDAVTMASASHNRPECVRAYRILVEEDPKFVDVNFSEWTLGHPANDPDLAFFRQHHPAILAEIITHEEIANANRNRLAD